MDLKIGEKIVALRKAKGMTQEQLAAVVGVSAPAVSKWETDNSYPDITLLVPLARALGTNIDALLAFEEELTQERLGQYMLKIINMAKEGKIEKAEEELNNLLHTYPTDIPLKFSATAALSFFEWNIPQCTTEDKKRWIKQKRELAQTVHDDGNPAYYLPAISMLVALALGEDELEKAEELLMETVTNTADFTSLWVQLYVKKGERDKALETVQRQLYKLTNEMQTCLMSMMGEDLALDTEREIKIYEISQMLDKLFHVGGDINVGLGAEIYLRAGKPEEALPYLEQMVERLLSGHMEPPNPILFAPAITLTEEQRSYSPLLRTTIVQGLERDGCFEPLRKEERFQKLIQRLKESLKE